MEQTSILWRRLDQPGHESAVLSESAAGAAIEGTAVFSESGQPCRLDYRVVCDATWRTVSARVTGWLNTTAIDVAIGADAAGSFVAMLETNAVGLVVHYPGLWQIEET